MIDYDGIDENFRWHEEYHPLCRDDEDGKFYVYVWRDIKTNEIFYVGSGQAGRYRSTHNKAISSDFIEYLCKHENVVSYKIRTGLKEKEARALERTTSSICDYLGFKIVNKDKPKARLSDEAYSLLDNNLREIIEYEYTVYKGETQRCKEYEGTGWTYIKDKMPPAFLPVKGWGPYYNSDFCMFDSLRNEWSLGGRYVHPNKITYWKRIL